MKTAQYKSLGLVVNLSVPESVEEFDQNAKRTGACLGEAINNIVYRGSLAEFRDKFCTAIETAFGVERKTKETGKTKKDEAGNDVPVLTYDETEAEFASRVKEEKSVSDADYQAIADKIAGEITFDAAAPERKPSAPKKLAQKYITDAKTALASGNMDKINARLEKAIGKTFTATDNAETDATTLGWLIKEFAEWNEAQQRAKLLA